MILAVLIAFSACGPDEDESVVRGEFDEPAATTAATSTETPPAEVSRGAMETQAEAPAGPGSNVDTAAGHPQTTSTPPQ